MFGGQIHAQSWWYAGTKDSATAVTYEADARIDSLIARKVKANQADSTSVGYRVQIFYGSSRESATEILKQFNVEYPKQKAYLIYEQPYFKVRIGDFPLRLGAEKWSRKVGQKYHGSFIVEDRINSW